MKFGLLPVMFLFACSLAAGMNNSDVLRVVKNGASTSEIIKAINESNADFHLDYDNVKRLRDHHVPEAVISGMFTRNGNGFAELPVQNEFDQYQPRPINRARGEALIVPDSTPVRLRLISNVSSTDVRLGDRIRFEVLEDVKVKNGIGNFLVIRREARVSGRN